MIRDYPSLFLNVLPVLLSQLAQLPDASFRPNSVFTGHADYLVDDLIDMDEPALVAQGRELSKYLASRR